MFARKLSVYSHSGVKNDFTVSATLAKTQPSTPTANGSTSPTPPRLNTNPSDELCRGALNRARHANRNRHTSHANCSPKTRTKCEHLGGLPSLFPTGRETRGKKEKKERHNNSQGNANKGRGSRRKRCSSPFQTVHNVALSPHRALGSLLSRRPSSAMSTCSLAARRAVNIGSRGSTCRHVVYTSTQRA